MDVPNDSNNNIKKEEISEIELSDIEVDLNTSQSRRQKKTPKNIQS